MKRKEITLEEVADKAGVSVSLIYYYIQKGLLPKPRHIPNRSKGSSTRGGGSLAVYPKSIIQNILRIKSELKKKRSLSRALKELSLKDKKKIVTKELRILLKLVNKKDYNEQILEEKLQGLVGFVASPSLASTCYTGEHLK